LKQEFRIDPKRVHAVPDAVDLDFFRPDCLTPDQRLELKASLGIPPHRPVVAYLGLLTDYQGTDKLLQAAAELRRRQVAAHFLIMGYPSVGHYQHMAEELGLSDWVTFTGKIPYERAPAFLALGDVAAAPKISDSEGSGKILNYMAMELPTVAFDMPVSREFLGDLGVLVEPGNPHALAGGIESLLSAPDKSSDLGRQSRRRVALLYSWDQAGRQIVSIYDGLVQAKQASGAVDPKTLTPVSTRDEGQESRRR
jgi:glycosyltransferase involved in cell wall biosynthesis